MGITAHREYCTACVCGVEEHRRQDVRSTVIFSGRHRPQVRRSHTSGGGSPSDATTIGVRGRRARPRPPSAGAAAALTAPAARAVSSTGNVGRESHRPPHGADCRGATAGRRTLCRGPDPSRRRRWARWPCPVNQARLIKRVRSLPLHAALPAPDGAERPARPRAAVDPRNLAPLQGEVTR